MKNPIFVSYSRKDKEIVFPLVQKLESELKVKCWIDRDGIHSGDEFRDKIIQAIDSSEVVLFMLSDNSDSSSYSKKEVEYAKNTNKKIIPIIVDGGKLRGWFLFEFGNIDYIDISNQEHLSKLSRDLKLLLGINDNQASQTNGSEKQKVSVVVQNNRITLDIVDKFSFVLEKDLTNNVFIGNIPVREILDYVKTAGNPNELTSTYLVSALVSTGYFIPSPILTAAYFFYKMFVSKKVKQNEIESKAFSAILSEINNRYNILLEQLSGELRSKTTIPLTEFAVSLDLSRIENSRNTLFEKLKSLSLSNQKSV